MPTYNIQELIARNPILQYVERDTVLKKVASTDGGEYAGACPFCIGKDRFRVQPQKDRWLCRNCTNGKWQDVINYYARKNNLDIKDDFREIAAALMGETHTTQTPEQKANAELKRAELLAEYEKRRAAQAAQEEETRAKRLSEFTTRELWDELHSRLDKQHRAWWRTQGIPDDLQDFWKLGYEKDHTYTTPQGNLCTSAFTIPYFQHDPAAESSIKFMTMQYRLQNPLNPNDRYRFAHGLKSSFFDCYPYEPIAGVVVICEGAKKAMNVSQIANKEWRILAMPSKSGDYGITEAVANAKLVFILLDPDGVENAHAKAAEIGRKARVVKLPFKVDDGIIQHGFTGNHLYAAMKQARA